MANDLIDAAILGDRDALEQLLNKFRSNAFSIAFKFVKDREDAEDVVQEAFVKVFVNIGKFRNESTFSTWIYRIVYVESLRHLRKKNKQQIVFQELDREDEMDSLTYSENDDEIMIEQKIKKAMDILSGKEYLVISLFYLSQKSINDIALVCNQSTSNVKVILHRARKRMLNFLNNVQ